MTHDPKPVERLAQELYGSGVLFGLALGGPDHIPDDPPLYADLPEWVREDCELAAEYILEREAKLQAVVEAANAYLDDCDTWTHNPLLDRMLAALDALKEATP